MANYNHTDYVKRAKAAYRAKSLKQVSVNFSQNDTDALVALETLAAHYGSQSKAIKAAILAHAGELKP